MSIEDYDEQEDFFTFYKLYTQNQESPQCFHFWTAVGIISGVVGRSLKLSRGYYDLYPNHFIIIVSNSALCRKSSALKVGMGILKDALGSLREGINIGVPVVLTGKLTPEALCRAISNKGINSIDGDTLEVDYAVGRPAMLYSSELGVFLSKSCQMNGLVDLMTDLYECPDEWEYLTKTQGTDFIYNSYICMMAATTPDWISNNVTGSVFNQGFVGRAQMVWSDTPNSRSAHPKFGKQEEEYKTVLTEHLLQIADLSGAFSFEPSAYSYYENWYNNRVEPQLQDEAESGFFGREHDHVLKLAMVYSLARRVSLILTEKDIKDAIKKIAETKPGRDRIFREVTHEREIYEMKYLESVIKEAKSIPRSKLMKKVYRKMKQEVLDECVASLVAAGIVEIEEAKTGKRGPGATVYTYRHKV